VRGHRRSLLRHHVFCHSSVTVKQTGRPLPTEILTRPYGQRFAFLTLQTQLSAMPVCSRVGINYNRLQNSVGYFVKFFYYLASS
jgi:hypothetical protein